jgi:hypothetical protein
LTGNYPGNNAQISSGVDSEYITGARP